MKGKPVKFSALTLIFIGWWVLNFWYRGQPNFVWTPFFTTQYVCLVIFAAYYLYLIDKN